MPFVIRSSDDQAMADAHAEWAKARARKEGVSEDDPRVDGLGAAVWKPAFLAGMKRGPSEDVLREMAYLGYRRRDRTIPRDHGCHITPVFSGPGESDEYKADSQSGSAATHC